MLDRRKALIGSACVLAGLAAPGPLRVQRASAGEGSAPIDVASRRIARFARVGGSATFGKLEFRGGLVLSADSKDFGGFSAVAIDADGRQLLALSDEGHWLAGEITYDGAAPSGIARARMGPILASTGRELGRKRDADAESITLLDGNLTNGTVLIGFERNHRIGRYPITAGELGSAAGFIKLPPEARRMRSNKGIEGLTVLRGGPLRGSILAISERFPDPPELHTGWIWIKGEPSRFHVRDIGGFDITDAAALADGSLLLLERRFRWSEGVKMRIRHFRADEIAPGATLEGDVLIEADLSHEIDNMEGLAVHTGARRETILTLISDDNFNHLLQRTVLLQFALAEEVLARAGRKAWQVYS